VFAEFAVLIGRTVALDLVKLMEAWSRWGECVRHSWNVCHLMWTSTRNALEPAGGAVVQSNAALELILGQIPDPIN
jgi:hypothetical protein